MKRRLFVMRHAERMDVTFGNWISNCFDENCEYRRYDLNQPASIPVREHPQTYFKDSPLTTMGLYQSTLIGESMRNSNVTFKHVYCSPAIRCIQTCANVLKALGLSDLPINIEYGLFEWMGWYHDMRPQWMSLEQLRSNGFNVNLDYKPVIAKGELEIRLAETIAGYYERSFFVASSILSETDGDVLFVAHAASLDVCTRKLVGKGPRHEQEFIRLIPKISYCAVIVAEESDDSWILAEPPMCSLTQSTNLRYDWKFLV
ncbi:protein UBASH3A-like protein [Dinothrombium tinctorium]|uniref:Protein UBASH3A-like protein n=1 Tax=Dinothrombium tinctorium TaxID=1965070 RepID=A0A443RJE4_9ACAR|nr:protein UBASH3A-like protein [Dinothrombium tinctorium]